MTTSFITIKIDQYLFGIDVSLVREVNRYIDITNVALSPEFVAGLLNLRGQIITILDPGIRLNLGIRTITNSTRCVVLKTKAELKRTQGAVSLNETVGLVVDAIGDIIKIDENEIEPLPSNIADLDSEFLSGVVKLDKELLLILKLDTILKIDYKRV
jgi:purine-binding chemotaxis protein CheW